MRDAISKFENHIVGVLRGIEACESGCSELARLGLMNEDVGLVLSGEEMERVRDCMNQNISPESDGDPDKAGKHAMHPRLAAAEVIATSDEGRSLYASSGYPADLIRRSRNDGASPSHAFGGILSDREARALAASILNAGAALWVRTRALDLTDEVAVLLLRISADRVRTFGVSPPEGSTAHDAGA